MFVRETAATGPRVFVVNADGSGERQLLPGNHECPRWSPDGNSILLTTDDPKRGLTMAIVSADGSTIRPLKIADATLTLGCGAWSPDGSRLALEGWDDHDPTRNGVYTIRSADGGDLVRVTSSPGGGHDIPGWYSPDGTQISFVRSTVPDHGTLQIVPVTGGPPRQFLGFDGPGAWSRDGKTILANEQSGALALVPVDGGSAQAIRLRSAGRDMTDPVFGCSWSPEGDRIVCSYGYSVSVGASGTGVYTMLADGSDLHRVTDASVDEEAGDWTR